MHLLKDNDLFFEFNIIIIFRPNFDNINI